VGAASLASISILVDARLNPTQVAAYIRAAMLHQVPAIVAASWRVATISGDDEALQTWSEEL
jgi:hypothetical protein